MAEKPDLKVVPNKGKPNGKAICITCEQEVFNVYGRVGEFHQVCSKKCCTAYEALPDDEKRSRRQQIQSIPFKAPSPDETSRLSNGSDSQVPGFKKQEPDGRRKK